MAMHSLIVKFSDLRKRSGVQARAAAEPQEERKTMADPKARARRPSSWRPGRSRRRSSRSGWLRLAAEGKAAKTVRTHTEAVAWFAAAHLLPRAGCTRWTRSAA